PRRQARRARQRRRAAARPRRAAVAAPGAVRRGVAGAAGPAGRAEAGGRRLRHRHRLPRAARLPPPHGAACAGRPAGGRRPRAAVRAAGRRAVRARGRGERPRGGVPGVEEVGGTRPLRPGGTRDPHDRAGAAGRVHRVGDRRDRPRPARRGDPRRAQPLVRAARRPPAPRAPPPPRPGAVGDPRARRRLTWGGQATRNGEPDMTDRTGEAGGRGVARQLIESHLVGGEAVPGREIGVRVDQTLTQDATGTLVMLELEALDLDRVRTDVSVQYVDHNLLQTDERNMADHIFLRSACRRYGLWYSKAGNGVSHPTHMQRFGVPGATMVGADSHTCAAGSLGMLAIGVGGLEVAMAMAGEPLHVTMPEIWGVRLTGELPPWLSAKDVILEMLRRHGVRGGVNRIIEYHGPGVASLTAMDRHVIANMGAELGATTTVFPSDERVLEFLRAEGREDDFTEIVADPGTAYDLADEIDLSVLEPL